ncbi:hypothetical protein PRELSG_0029350 [Plasmodium relictum]|uniref:Uncharacterized protein n=1 Tax=Plasmodium relictum TaxID=85471 RepID=A0A1J1GNZ4_PLARL|nr:hypothetical protein PRELSG_0029350 [Plasmodium relictum]CRG84874.1 hypothetical protein PRELSG_0029350 [Plasmodium relictum]
MEKNIYWIFFVMLPLVLFGTVLSYRDVPKLNEPANRSNAFGNLSQGTFNLRSFSGNNSELLSFIKKYKSFLTVQGRKLKNIKYALDEIKTHLDNKFASIYWDKGARTQLSREDYKKEFAKFNEFYDKKINYYYDLKNDNIAEHAILTNYNRELNKRINRLAVLPVDVQNAYSEVMKILKENIEAIYYNLSICNIISDNIKYIDKNRDLKLINSMDQVEEKVEQERTSQTNQESQENQANQPNQANQTSKINKIEDVVNQTMNTVSQNGNVIIPEAGAANRAGTEENQTEITEDLSNDVDQETDTLQEYEMKSLDNTGKVQGEIVETNNNNSAILKVMVVVGVLGGLFIFAGVGYFIYNKKLLNIS